MLAEQLAQRTLELVDVPSESRSEDALAAHVMGVLSDAGVPFVDAGDTCVVAGTLDAPRIVLAGHLDTVPAQDNIPGFIEGGAVHGLGAADMKGADAVMLELALAGAPFTYVWFGREELPHAESSLTPLLERMPALRDAELAVVMEPTANALHAGCLGNIVATLTVRGRSGHSARPWNADNAIHRLAPAIADVAAQRWEEHTFAGLTFTEAMSVVGVEGGIAINVIPDEATARINYRYAPGRTPNEAERRLHAICDPHGELVVASNAPSGGVPLGNPLVERLRSLGLAWEPKQAWTPVAEFALAGVDAVNFGPGDPAFAHTRDEQVSVLSLVRAYEVLEELAAA
jgi:succinyl-diaminopimelate desuccinylase